MKRVTVGDLVDADALNIPSIVENPRQIIDESDRQLDCDRHAVDDARLFNDAELLADDRAEMAQTVEAEALDLTGPGVEEGVEEPRWSQQDVALWADRTFGPSPSNARIAARANEEMSELLRALTCDDNAPNAIEEAADVVIVLYRLVERMGGNLMRAIDDKMEVNVGRKWNVSGGHGQHVRTKPLDDLGGES